MLTMVTAIDNSDLVMMVVVVQVDAGSVLGHGHCLGHGDGDCAADDQDAHDDGGSDDEGDVHVDVGNTVEDPRY